MVDTRTRSGRIIKKPDTFNPPKLYWKTITRKTNTTPTLIPISTRTMKSIPGVRVNMTTKKRMIMAIWRGSLWMMRARKNRLKKIPCYIKKWKQI